MKRLLPHILLASLLACAPSTTAQAIHPDDVPRVYASEVGSKPADNIVPLYPKRVNKKKLKLKPNSAFPPLGFISVGQSLLTVSICPYEHKVNPDGILHDIITVSSKDGTQWNQADIAIPQIKLPWSERRVGAVYDSVKKHVVLLFLDTRHTKVAKKDESVHVPGDSVEASDDALGTASQKGKRKKGRKRDREEDAFGDEGDDAFKDEGVTYSHTFENNKVYVSVGKDGKFSKPKNITRQFTNQQGETDINLKNLGLCFQGICLAKGKYRGRLLFLTIIADKTMCSIYSDNHGLSWHIGKPFKINTHSPADCAGPSALGSRGDNLGLTMFEADDGSIVSFTGHERHEGEEGYRATWISSEDGGVSWIVKTSKPGQSATRPNPYGQAYLVLNAEDGEGTGSRLLAFSLSSCSFSYGGIYDTDGSAKDRANGNNHYVAISYDWGLTWPHKKPLGVSWFHEGRNVPIQQIAPGTIGMIALWQFTTERRQFYRAPGFTSFSISWLTNGKDDGIGELKTTGSNASTAE